MPSRILWECNAAKGLIAQVVANAIVDMLMLIEVLMCFPTDWTCGSAA
jgi:hypothetical protein